MNRVSSLSSENSTLSNKDCHNILTQKYRNISRAEVREMDKDDLLYQTVYQMGLKSNPESGKKEKYVKFCQCMIAVRYNLSMGKNDDIESSLKELKECCKTLPNNEQLAELKKML